MRCEQILRSFSYIKHTCYWRDQYISLCVRMSSLVNVRTALGTFVICKGRFFLKAILVLNNGAKTRLQLNHNLFSHTERFCNNCHKNLDFQSELFKTKRKFSVFLEIEVSKYCWWKCLESDSSRHCKLCSNFLKCCYISTKVGYRCWG